MIRVLFCITLLVTGIQLPVIAQDYLPMIATQRQIAIEARYKLKTLAGEINDKKISVQNLLEQYNSVRLRMKELEDEKNNAIKDMKAGYYCDQCWRSKTQIEKDGENFNAHLRSVSGQMTALPNNKMLQTERDYDDKIYQLKKQSDALFSNINIIRQKIADLMAQADKQPYIWETAIKEEDRLRILNWKERLDAIDRMMNAKLALNENVDALVNDKKVISQRQETEKTAWIAKVMEEKDEINRSLFLIGKTHTYYFYTLAGKDNYNIYYDMNEQPSIYQNNARELIAPQRTLPSEDKNLKNYLQNLGNSNKQ